MRCAVLVLLVACIDAEPYAPLASHDSRAITFDISSTRPRKLDVVFVIDDSTNMAPYVERTRILPRLFEVALPEYHPGVPDLRALVVTASGTVRGMLVDAVEPAMRVRNFEGPLADALGALLDVGASSTEIARPLAAVTAVLATPDFLRARAELLIVTISATDDASPLLASEYVRIVKASKPQYAFIYPTGLFPPGATRLDQFHDGLGGHSTSIDWMQYDISFKRPEIPPYGVASTCIEEPADVDPLTAGTQYECAVSMIDDETGTETVLRPCTEEATLCWELRHHDPACSGATSETFHVAVRGYETYRPHVRGQCAS